MFPPHRGPAVQRQQGAHPGGPAAAVPARAARLTRHARAQVARHAG